MASSARAILDHVSVLRDPRQRWRVVYPLPEVLLLVLCATLCGMEDFVETKLWGEERLDFLRRFLPYERGIPAHDTLNDVVNGLDPDLFKLCFTSWAETLQDDDPEVVAIDGKTSRRTHEWHGRKCIARLMREAGLVGARHRRGGPATTRRDREDRPAPDLVDRNFSAEGPDRLWVGEPKDRAATSPSCRRPPVSFTSRSWSTFSSIEGWFNPLRLRSALGYRSPVAYEKEHRQTAAEAA